MVWWLGAVGGGLRGYRASGMVARGGSWWTPGVFDPGLRHIRMSAQLAGAMVASELLGERSVTGRWRRPKSGSRLHSEWQLPRNHRIVDAWTAVFGSGIQFLTAATLPVVRIRLHPHGTSSWFALGPTKFNQTSFLWSLPAHIGADVGRLLRVCQPLGLEPGQGRSLAASAPRAGALATEGVRGGVLPARIPSRP